MSRLFRMPRVIVAGLVLAMATVSVAAEAPVASWNAEGTVLTLTNAQAPAPDQEAKPEAKAVQQLGDRDRLGFLQRRRLGLTVGAIRSSYEQALADGRIGPDTPNSVAAAVVAEDLVRSNPQAYKAEAGSIGRDWDAFFEALLAFIEKVLPLILLFLG